MRKLKKIEILNNETYSSSESGSMIALLNEKVDTLLTGEAIDRTSESTPISEGRYSSPIIGIETNNIICETILLVKR